MKLTPKLKSWLVDNTDVKADATEDDFTKAAADSLASGGLSVDNYKELTTSEEDVMVGEFNSTMKGMAATLEKMATILTEDRKASKPADDEYKEDDEDEEAEKKPKKKPREDVIMKDDEEGEKDKASNPPREKRMRQRSSMEKMLMDTRGQMEGLGDDEDRRIDIRVKEAADCYSMTTKAMVFPASTKSGRAHPYAGLPVQDYSEPGSGRVMNELSERDRAVVGSFGKFLCQTARQKSRSLGFHTLPQHDKELLLYAMENMPWGGATDGGDFADIKNRRLTPNEQKQLIDDATSGGLEAAPIVFDDDVIQTPLLHGELFPLVRVVPLDRGRRVEGVATGTVTANWGGVDDTAITLFNTTAYVTAFDTTIFRWEGAIRVGLDFLSDTPIDFGAHLTAQYGERLLEDLDDVIATGNGTTQPEGIMNATGTTSITFGGTTTLGSYESLRFGVARPEHRANLAATAVFCGTETSYQRARAIPVGASDARRLGGNVSTVGGVTNYSDYSWMGYPYKINESLTNAQVFYAILARYRMYRRRGLTMRTSTEGDTLIRRNEMLLVAMSRYGGQLERGATAAVTTDAPA